MDDNELFEIVQRNYAEVNKDYIQQQIQIASEYLTDEQKADLQNKGYMT